MHLAKRSLAVTGLRVNKVLHLGVENGDLEAGIIDLCRAGSAPRRATARFVESDLADPDAAAGRRGHRQRAQSQSIGSDDAMSCQRSLVQSGNPFARQFGVDQAFIGQVQYCTGTATGSGSA